MSREKIYDSPAARMRAYRERQKKAGFKQILVRLDATTVARLSRLCPDCGVTSVAQVIELMVGRMVATIDGVNNFIDDVFSDDWDN